MPQVILQTNSLSTGTSMSSAPVAFLSMEEQQPQSRTLRILKRPSNNTPAASHQTAAPVLSMKEREAAYAAARDRIFNTPSSSSTPASSSPDAAPIVAAPSSSMTPAPARTAGRGSGSSSNNTANTSNQGNTSMGCISRDPIGSTGPRT